MEIILITALLFGGLYGYNEMDSQNQQLVTKNKALSKQVSTLSSKNRTLNNKITVSQETHVDGAEVVNLK